MNVLEWVVSGLGSGQQGNPSGAIDVVAIKRRDGTYGCSPFHVKMLHVSKQKDMSRIVKLKVNGKFVSLSMKLGPADEAFFVERARGSGRRDNAASVLKETPLVDCVPISSISESKSLPSTAPEIFQYDFFLQNTTPQALTGNRRIRSKSDLHELYQHSSLYRSANSHVDSADHLLNLISKDDTFAISKASPDVPSPQSGNNARVDANVNLVMEGSWTWKWGDLPVKSSPSSNPVLEGFLSSQSPLLSGTSASGKVSDIVERTGASVNKSMQNILAVPPLVIPTERIGSVEDPISSRGKPILSSRTSRSGSIKRLAYVLSLCGHILGQSAGSSAPEPAPRFPHELTSVLASYAIPVSKLTVDVMRDPTLVVIAGDFLLPFPVAVVLFEMLHCLDEGQATDKRNEPAYAMCEALKRASEDGENKAVDILDAGSAQSASPSLSESGGTKNLYPFSGVSDRIVADAIDRFMSLIENNTNSIEGTVVGSLPPWSGCRISTWIFCDNDVSEQSNSPLYANTASNSTATTAVPEPIMPTSSSVSNGSCEIPPSLPPEIAGSPSFIATVASSSNSSMNSALKPWRESFSDLLLSLTSSHSAEELRLTTGGSIMSAFHEDVLDAFLAYEDSYGIWNDDDDDGAVEGNSDTVITALDISYKATENRSTYASAVVNDNSNIATCSVCGSSVSFDPGASCSVCELAVIRGDEDITDHDDFSLEDVSLDEISPGPAEGDFYDSDTDSYLSLSLEDGEKGRTVTTASANNEMNARLPSRSKKYPYRKLLVPSQEHLQALGLLPGENEVRFELEVGGKAWPWVFLQSQLFLWPADAKIVVVDIEGAVTPRKVDVGVWGTFLRRPGNRSSVHAGVVELLINIRKQGYHILYIAQHVNEFTRDYLRKISGAGPLLPAGPIFQSPSALVQAFGAERTELFKAAALRGLKGLFPDSHNPYYACFGTRVRDKVAFLRCGVPLGRVFLVDDKGLVQSGNHVFKRSFADINDNLSELFPPISDSHARETEFVIGSTIEKADDSFSLHNFWKIPPSTIDC